MFEASQITEFYRKHARRIFPQLRYYYPSASAIYLVISNARLTMTGSAFVTIGYVSWTQVLRKIVHNTDNFIVRCCLFWLGGRLGKSVEI